MLRGENVVAILLLLAHDFHLTKSLCYQLFAFDFMFGCIYWKRLSLFINCSWRETLIGDHTKIDNLVQVLSLLHWLVSSPFPSEWQFLLQIGHNVVIGKCCMICGQVGIAGSATYVYLRFIGYIFFLLRNVRWFFWAIFQVSSCSEHAGWGTILHWVVGWQFGTTSPLFRRCSFLSSVLLALPFYAPYIKLVWIQWNIGLPCVMFYCCIVPGYIAQSTSESF